MRGRLTMRSNRSMDDSLRASDQDREEIAGILREQYAQGRLTLEEFDERSSAAYSARTVGDLRPLVADLPGPGAPARTTDAVRSPAQARLIGMAGAVAAVVLLAAALFAGRAVLALPGWLVIIVVMRVVRGGHGGGRRGGRR